MAGVQRVQSFTAGRLPVVQFNAVQSQFADSAACPLLSSKIELFETDLCDELLLCIVGPKVTYHRPKVSIPAFQPARSDFFVSGCSRKSVSMVYLRFCPGYVLRLFTVVAIALCFWVHPGLAAVPQAPGRSITVVVPEKFPPLIYRDDSGEVRGMTRDLWSLWETPTGIHVDLQLMPWGQALRQVQAGQADVIDLITVTEARKNVFDFSEPYLDLDVVLFFDKSITGIVDASSTKGLLVGVGEGDACAQALMAAGSTNLKTYPTPDVQVSAAAMGEVRVFCAQQKLASYLLHRLAKADDFRHTPPIYSALAHWAVPKGHAETTRLVSDGFAHRYPDIGLTAGNVNLA